MTKKLTSLALALVLCLSLCVPAFASETNSVEAEIEMRTELAMKQAEESLSKVNAAYSRVYREFISAKIEQEVLAERGVRGTPRARYSMTYGGVVTYVTFDELTNDRFEIAVTLLDRDKTLDFILEGAKFSVGNNIIKPLLGYLPLVGDAFSTVFNIDSACNAATMTKISNAGGYTEITNIICTSYPSDGGVSFVDGWTTHPYFTTPSNATSVGATWF